MLSIEGTLLGPDLNILSKINNLDVPLIYSGGISSLANIKDVITQADAAAAGSLYTKDLIEPF